ncbi:hypothetical protein Q7P37_004338 [Cladosporium fusiforme]
MKVIKVGTTAQSRIAQACDRCRSKKIRCDGVRPCCSQCANVGFECKTSDKLSRRAFPRGYTESLEERVRALETEVRELKDLLDEKDEKIDMLSRIHSQSPRSIQLPSPRRSSVQSDKKSEPEPDDTFMVQQSPSLHGEGTDSYFAGTSSARTFIEAFKHKVQEGGKSTADIDTDRLLATRTEKADDSRPVTPASAVVWKSPSRMVSDQLVNIFFQEWAPLFPILHRPTFLTLYERYTTDADDVTDKAEIAQLNLVFGVAAMSGGARSSEDLESFDSQWKAAVDAILTDNCMATLQALILAQICCIQQGDLTRLLTYKGLSTTLSARLGLHQSQKRFALGTLTCETRKKVFWTLYTVDCFSSVVLGLPKNIKDEDVHCEDPVDADDEYVTERGFQPTLPGESTKLSSALALFKASRILSKVLEEVFPAKASYDLSLKKLSDLSDELDAWNAALPQHLRLPFAQDKPTVGTISSRSPILSLTYHYIRALIQRPAVCASLGSKSSSAMLSLSGSCKSIVQIVQLLEERSLSFSFCLNKDEVLVLSGFGLLFQSLTLDPSSKILRESQKMITSIQDILTKSNAPCAPEFKKASTSFFPLPEQPVITKTPSSQSLPKSKTARHNSESSLPKPQTLQSSTKKQLKALASRFTPSASASTSDLTNIDRRATVPSISLQPKIAQAQSQPSLSPQQSFEPVNVNISRSEPALSPGNIHPRPASASMRPSVPPQHAHIKPKRRPTPQNLTNLDYLSFTNDPEAQAPSIGAPIKTEPQPTDWEKLLGSLDGNTTNIFDACYGGQPVEGLLDASNTNNFHQHIHPTAALTANHATHANQPSALDWNADLWSLYQTNSSASSAPTAAPERSAHNGSIWSYSTEDRSNSTDDLNAATGNWSGGSSETGPINEPIDNFPGIVLPDLGLNGEEFTFPFSEWGDGCDQANPAATLLTHGMLVGALLARLVTGVCAQWQPRALVQSSCPLLAGAVGGGRRHFTSRGDVLAAFVREATSDAHLHAHAGGGWGAYNKQIFVARNSFLQSFSQYNNKPCSYLSFINSNNPAPEITQAHQQQAKPTTMTDKETSTLQSYVDTATGYAQSALGSVTGSQADKDQAEEKKAQGEAREDLSKAGATIGGYSVSAQGVAENDPNRSAGSWNQTVGAGKEAIGGALGLEGMRKAGEQQNADGKGQEAQGQLSDLGKGISDRVGGTVGGAFAGLTGDEAEKKKRELQHDEGKTLQRGVESEVSKKAEA